METEANCMRCSCCCMMIIDNKQSDIPCKYLVKLSSGRSVCRIYKSRIGKKLGYDNVCVYRKDMHYNFKHPVFGDCPYNQDSWKYIEKVNDDERT